MKYIAILFLSLFLGGCGFMNRDDVNDGTTKPDNQTEQPNQPGNQAPNDQSNNQTTKNELKDVFTYFDEQKLEYANAKDVDVTGLNAYEGKMFEYQNNPVYIYRMKTTDSNVKSWMEEIKNTGKVTINQNGKEDVYDAIVNNDYMLVTKSGTDLNKLSEMFKKYGMK